MAVLTGPVRNSKQMPAIEAADELEQLHDDRMVWIWINHKKTQYPSREEAIHALRLMRRPKVGDWISVEKRRGLIGLITIDEKTEQDSFTVVYGDPVVVSDPYLSLDEVQLIDPVTDVTLWRRVLRLNGESLMHAPCEIKENSRCVLTAARQNPKAIRHVKHLVDVICDVAAIVPKVLDHCAEQVCVEVRAKTPRPIADCLVVDSPDLKNLSVNCQTSSGKLFDERKDWLLRLREQKDLLNSLPDEARSDREFVLAAVECSGGQVRYASDALRADRQVAFVAVQNYGASLQYLAPSLQADREIVLAAAKQDPLALRFAETKLRYEIIGLPVPSDAQEPTLSSAARAKVFALPYDVS